MRFGRQSKQNRFDFMQEAIQRSWQPDETGAHIKTEYNFTWKHKQQSAYGGVLHALDQSLVVRRECGNEHMGRHNERTNHCYTSSIRIIDNYIGHRTRYVNIDFLVGLIRIRDATARSIQKPIHAIVSFVAFNLFLVRIFAVGRAMGIIFNWWWNYRKSKNGCNENSLTHTSNDERARVIFKINKK